MKRRYFSYLGPHATTKRIPSSTIWNRRKRNVESIVARNLPSHISVQTNDVLESQMLSIESMVPTSRESHPNEEDIAWNYSPENFDAEPDEPQIISNLSEASTPRESYPSESCMGQPEPGESSEGTDAGPDESPEDIEIDIEPEEYSRRRLNRLFETEINTEIRIKIRDVMLMIYGFSIRHNLDWQMIESLTELIKTIIGDPAIPQSKYYFKKLFCLDEEIKPKVHFNCHSCKKYLGVEDDLKRAESDKKCGICETPINLKRKYRDRNFFITIPIAPQLRRHIKCALSNNRLQFHSDVIDENNGYINDIFDGDHYKDAILHNRDQKFVTLTLNTDGAIVFRATKKSSIWPLQFHINEINDSHRFRRDNVLISTLAFGATPDMSAFLRPFLNEVRKINTDGGIVVPINNKIERILVIPLLWTLDSVAKCDVLDKVQYNGYFGCPYCHHPGTKVRGKCILYSNKDNAEDREDSDTRNAMKEAHDTGEWIRGYRGISALYVLPKFDLNWQIVIDKMHNVELGVTKKLFDLFLSSIKNPYSVRSRINDIDKRILALKLPKQITRNLRSLSDVTHFKASEWRTIVLYAGIPILFGIMPQRYLNNFVKLVDAYHIFNSNDISNENFERGSELIREFVYEFEQLYGVENMVFNVHILLHIPKCVKKNGPLCMYSTYNMEDSIGKIVSNVHGTNDALAQICDRYLLQKNLVHNLEDSPLAKKYYEKIRNTITEAKPLKRSNLSVEERLLIENTIGTDFIEFKSMYLNGVFYEIQDDLKDRRSGDYFCITKTENMGVIRSIFTATDNTRSYYLLLRNVYSLMDNNISHSVQFLQLNPEPHNFIIKEDELGKKAVLMVADDDLIAYSTFPNLCERD